MTDPLFSVAGRVVLVTGGSRGLGRPCAWGWPNGGPGRHRPAQDRRLRAIGCKIVITAASRCPACMSATGRRSTMWSRLPPAAWGHLAA